MRCYVLWCSGPHPMLRWALMLSRVPQPQISPLCRGGLRRCHVSYSSRHLLPAKGGLRHYRVIHGSRPHLPAGVSFDTVRHPAALYGPRASDIKKSLAGLAIQLGSCVFNACSCVSRASDTRAIMICKTCGQMACKMCGHAVTVQRRSY
jgi:hypothetical protein